MDGSGIETLLQAAALDAATFLRSSANPQAQQPILSSWNDSSVLQRQAYLGSVQLPPIKPYLQDVSPNLSYQPIAPSRPELAQISYKQPSSASLPSSSSFSLRNDADGRRVAEGCQLPSDTNSEIWDHCSLCTPGTAPQGNVDWIECSVCQQWFHYACVDLTAKIAKIVDDFHCVTCAKSHGPSTCEY